MPDASLQERFLSLWSKHFGGAELPLSLHYSDDPGSARPLARPAGHLCMIGQLARARRGEVLCFEAESFGCFGGKRYMGFTDEAMPGFEHFLSCGIPGKMEGERYKKTPEIVRESFAKVPAFRAPARYAIFKRWDRLEAGDVPGIVIFFAAPDVLSGLFTLAGFDETRIEAVIAPFGAGCASIAQYPYLEGQTENPRAVLGMFDVSARPFVEQDVLTFAVPLAKFERMVGNMDESFLITASWAKVRRRIAGRSGGAP
jgi:uncharacterized protein (DUF169 family)